MLISEGCKYPKKTPLKTHILSPPCLLPFGKFESVYFLPFLPWSWKWKIGPSHIRFLSFRATFHFHDYGRKGKHPSISISSRQILWDLRYHWNVHTGHGISRLDGRPFLHFLWQGKQVHTSEPYQEHGKNFCTTTMSHCHQWKFGRGQRGRFHPCGKERNQSTHTIPSSSRQNLLMTWILEVWPWYVFHVMLFFWHITMYILEPKWLTRQTIW